MYVRNACFRYVEQWAFRHVSNGEGPLVRYQKCRLLGRLIFSVVETSSKMRSLEARCYTCCDRRVTESLFWSVSALCMVWWMVKSCSWSKKEPPASKWSPLSKNTSHERSFFTRNGRFKTKGEDQVNGLVCHFGTDISKHIASCIRILITLTS